MNPHNPKFEIVYPHDGYMEADMGPKSTMEVEKNKNVNRASEIQFFRSYGFRRIGLNSYFGFTNDTSRPSNKLSSSLDEETSEDFECNCGLEDETIREIRLAALRRESPLIHAVMSLSDMECVTLLKTKYSVDNAH